MDNSRGDAKIMIKVLGFDTSSTAATIALAEEGRLIAEYYLNNKRNHSEKLMPLIQQMLSDCDITLNEIQGIAVAMGPGSFTGLRIGAATAKGLAFAAGIPIIGINTLDGLAYNAVTFNGPICPVLNARREQVYTALFRGNGMSIERLTDYMAVEIKEILKTAGETGEPVLFLGDGVPVYKDEIKNMLGKNALFAPEALTMPRASSIALLGVEGFKKGEVESPFTFTPFYLRRSQAEIQLEK
jgi:tRNA threonylcarbamoyladenosine biosynthesis protein TsaB